VKSLTGTWRTDAFASISGVAPATFTLTQSGAVITGTFSQGAGSGQVSSGAVAPTSPRVSLTVTPLLPGLTFLPFVFTGEPSADVNTITGVLNSSGFSNVPVVLKR
jgi:hypothetical protein